MHIVNMHGIIAAAIAGSVTFGLVLVLRGIDWEPSRPFIMAVFAILLFYVDVNGRSHRIHQVSRTKEPGKLQALFHPIAGGSLAWLIPFWVVSIGLLAWALRDALAGG